MSNNLIKIIHEFESIIKSEPPFGEYYKGDVVNWIDNKLKKEDFESKRILRTNFLNICIAYLRNKNGDVNENVINAQKVISHFDENIIHLKLNKNFDAAQLITLFRVLQKDLELFDNTDEEVMDVLNGVFKFSKENIRTYFIREQYKIKAKKLFRYEWDELI